MKVFAEFIKLAFKIMFQYKWTFAITVIVQPIILFINLALFKSIYAYNHTASIKGYSLEQMVWYTTAYWIVLGFIWNSTTQELSRKILSGDLTMDLLKPFPVIRVELAVNVASRVIALIMDTIPGMVVYSLIIFPKFLTMASLFRFLTVVLLAFFLNYLTAFLLGLFAMSLKNNSSMLTISNLLVSFAGGAFIPLEFFPDWFNRIVTYLPFKYIVYWPIQFFINKPTTGQFAVWAEILIIQLGWIVLLYIACKFLWKKMIKRYCAVGG
jgi:ABC-2 type transport system permease protein